MGFMDTIKDVAEKVGDTVGKGVKSVSETSQKVAEKMKLKKQINQLEAEINAAYIVIGKKYFDENSASPAPEYEEEINKIISNREKSESLKAELNALDDKITCPKCGASLLIEQNFCDKCGENLAEVKEKMAAASSKTCAECGAAVQAGHNFCEKCGASLSDEAEHVDAIVIDEKKEESDS